MHQYKLYSGKIAIFHPLDGYYNFILYHMQPGFYILLMNWCLSAFCFMVEVLYNLIFSKRKWSWFWVVYFLCLIALCVTQDYFNYNLPTSELVLSKYHKYEKYG
jgi:hypothetical protein